MTDSITIARPYAKAAFDFAVEKDSLESWHKMLAFAAQVSNDPQIRSQLMSDMKPDSIAKLFIQICDGFMDEYGANFIKVMAENKRLALLPEVLTLFEKLKLERESQADVEVISAQALSKKQLDDISTFVEKRLSRKINLKCYIDNSLISGFIIRSGDMVIDSSIRGRLNRLNESLQS